MTIHAAEQAAQQEDICNGELPRSGGLSACSPLRQKKIKASPSDWRGHFDESRSDILSFLSIFSVADQKIF